MKFLSLMILLLTLVACGKESKTNFSSSTTQFSYNGLKLNSATLFLPGPGNNGGSKSLKIGTESYIIDLNNSSYEVNQYLILLQNNQIAVTPLATSSIGKEFRVGYVGVTGKGPCMNPTSTCNNIVLTQVIAF